MRFLAGCLLCCLVTLAAAQEAGKIDFLEGGVRLYDGRKQERPAQVGVAINEGDTLETGADGEVHVAMADGGQLAIRPVSVLRVQNYRADGGKEDRSVLNLVKGAMRSITGWIGKYNAKNYEIRTPTATIGVRGTDHETRVVPEGSPEGEAGTYDKVNVGATRMTTAAGVADIAPNQAGFFAAHGRDRPRLLDRVPAFFRPTRNEQRLEGLDERIHQRIENLRQQRIRELGQRPAAQRESAERLQERRQARGQGTRRFNQGGPGEMGRRRLEDSQDLRQRRLETLEQRRQAQGMAGMADDGLRPRRRLAGDPAGMVGIGGGRPALRHRHPLGEGGDVKEEHPHPGGELRRR